MKLSAYRLDYGIALCFILLILTEFLNPNQVSNVRSAHAFLPDAFHSPTRVFESYKGSSPGKIAIFFHGFRGSASRMTLLARQLARAGFKVYVPDMPGHGESEAKLPLKIDCQPTCAAQASEDFAHEIIQGALQFEGTKPNELLILGHSWGAYLIHKVSPSDSPHLILKRVFLDGPSPAGTESNQDLFLFSSQEIRARRFDPNQLPHRNASSRPIADTTHWGIIESPNASHEITKWLSPGEENAPPRAPVLRDSTYRGMQLILLVVALMLVLLWFAPHKLSFPPVLSIKAALALTIFSALLARLLIWKGTPQPIFSAFRLLGQMHYIFLFTFGLLATLGLFILRPKIERPKKDDLLAILTAAGIFSVTYIIVGPFATHRFLDLNLTFSLVPPLLMWAGGIFPSAYFISFSARSVQNPWLRFGFKYLLWALAILIWSFCLRPKAYREALEILALIGVFEVFGTIISSRVQKNYVGAIVVSLYLGWIATLLYPRF